MLEMTTLKLFIANFVLKVNFTRLDFCMTLYLTKINNLDIENSDFFHSSTDLFKILIINYKIIIFHCYNPLLLQQQVIK